ncbi:E3 ubiquitin-protein ligase TRIM56-like [Dysidea avara]|uniref:E3 ubiquitin-protein ligase TRIM56-like n=1 Tax=Dysidea avara TaxID=196820 RepID=UPI00332765D2
MSDLKIVEDNLTCPICYELFQNPKCLPCQHTYCEGCLERVQKVSKISCPECRAEASVPAGGVKELPTSFVISRLLDELSLKKKATTEKKYKCGKCNDDVPVVSYCGDCTTFLCQSCRELHQRSKIYGGHHVVPLAEMKDHTPAILANHHSSETNNSVSQSHHSYVTVSDNDGHDNAFPGTFTASEIQSVQDQQNVIDHVNAVSTLDGPTAGNVATLADTAHRIFERSH